MAKKLFIVDDDVYRGLPGAVRKALLDEVKRLFSFIPGFTVEAVRPDRFPATLHFTDSVVKIVESDGEVTGALNDMHRQEDLNVRFSIKQTGIRLTLNPLSLSAVGKSDRGGVGDHWKTTTLEGGGQRVSITMTYGAASLEFAEQAVVDEEVNEQTLEEVHKAFHKALAKKGLGLFAKHEVATFLREERQLEQMAKHMPLKDWPQNEANDVATALARLVAHEARHQYIQNHSANGLGADSAKIWGDKNFEQFDRVDRANILTAINRLDRDFNRASIHLETAPQGQPSPFA